MSKFTYDEWCESVGIIPETESREAWDFQQQKIGNLETQAHRSKIDHNTMLDIQKERHDKQLAEHEIKVLGTVFAKFSKDGPSGLMFDHFALLRHVEKLKKEIK